MGNIQSITDKLIQRYSDRYKKSGRSISTLGWGSREQQEYRFGISLNLLPDLEKSSILDVGCGFGDFHRFLKDRGKASGRYCGMDINPDLISEAQKTASGSDSEFKVFNLLQDDLSQIDTYDYVFMFGLLNFRLREEMTNTEYSQLFIKKAFSVAQKSLVLDFISSHRDSSYPEEDFIYYHDPIEMLEYCLSLTPHVTLLHDYQSIPQRECTIVLSRQPRV